MLCYISTKNEKCNFLKSLLITSVSFISEQPSYDCFNKIIYGFG